MTLNCFSPFRTILGTGWPFSVNRASPDFFAQRYSCPHPVLLTHFRILEHRKYMNVCLSYFKKGNQVKSKYKFAIVNLEYDIYTNMKNCSFNEC